jgi:hypothetical protein
LPEILRVARELACYGVIGPLLTVAVVTSVTLQQNAAAIDESDSSGFKRSN